MKKLLLTLALWAVAASSPAAIKVATLHPILADLARQVGGDHVEVIEILRPGGDLHHFEPVAKDIGAMRGAALLLAGGCIHARSFACSRLRDKRRFQQGCYNPSE